MSFYFLNFISIIIVIIITGNPIITEFTYDSSVRDFICISSGGPATKVQWKKNSQLLNTDGTNYQKTQRIISTENATYENKLHVVDDSMLYYNDSIECLVMNSRGNHSSSIVIEGNKNLCLINF